MIINILMIILGFVLLVVGANLLVKGASNIANKFHIPEMLIGLTIVALGTSAPELIITITSAQSGATDLIVGNAIGSNLCNLLFILGVISIIRPVLIDDEARKVHIPIALFSAIIIIVMSLGFLGGTKNFINTSCGLLLLILFAVYFTYPIFIEIKDIIKSYKCAKNGNNSRKNISVLLSIVFIIIGILLLKYGGDFVVNSSTAIAEHLGISERIIGLTIVAVGTAVPELITSIVAIIRKDNDLAVGNLVGSCVLNLLLILGIGAVITPLEFSSEFIQNLILLCVSTFILWIFNFIGKKNTITRWKGLILLLIFTIYIIGLFV